ncbi:hypothetical protein SAMN05216601_10866 [Ectopseudomonas composti]|uniref:Uncharacterized protein n=1 Tax=Ectopseudomonas composti TaxID=658457 RepID=A0A1I5P4H1_9GAMM|nr:hypothetical protein [Pseudomonas composti]SFP28994.1 hypothetical protein SAMN05216601_10866 [Pseudomonas composti]
MDGQSLAGLGWLFELFDGAVNFLIVATAPFLAMVGHEISEWLLAVAFLALIIMMIRLPNDGPFRAIFSTTAIFLAIVYGLQPTPLTLTNGTTVQATHAQRIAYTLIMSFNATLNRAIAATLSEVNVDGQFIPTAALIDYSVERTASQYANSDLGRLIRDYNQQCSPPRTQFATDAEKTSVEAYHAIGLLGGAGIGIPDEQVSRLAQIRIAGGSVIDFAAAMSPWSSNADALDSISVLDAGAVRNRREEGLAALAKDNQVFVASESRPYTLPTKEHWAALASGQPDAKPSYLKVGDAPGDIRDSLIDHVHAWKPDEGGKEAALGYSPSSCVEAYKVAQFAAEQAYKAFVELGDRHASGGQSTDTQAGVISAGKSWMKIQQATLAGGPEQKAGTWNTLLSGSIASWQMGKSWMNWLELQTLLPAYVGGMAGFFWLVFMTGPIAIALSPLRGVSSLTQWAGMMFFPVLCITFAHLLAVCASVLMSAAALVKAALSAGWQGGGSDIDLIYGSLQLVFGLLLAASTWLAASMTGVSLGGLARAARNQAVTGPQVAQAVANLTMKAATKGAIQGKEKGENPSRENGGGGGGSGGGGAGKASSGGHSGRAAAMAIQQEVYASTRTRNWKPSTELSRPPQLNQPASNSDRFAKGRTPRSQKNRPSEEDPA